MIFVLSCSDMLSSHVAELEGMAEFISGVDIEGK